MKARAWRYSGTWPTNTLPFLNPCFPPPSSCSSHCTRWPWCCTALRVRDTAALQQIGSGRDSCGAAMWHSVCDIYPPPLHGRRHAARAARPIGRRQHLPPRHSAAAAAGGCDPALPMSLPLHVARGALPFLPLSPFLCVPCCLLLGLMQAPSLPKQAVGDYRDLQYFAFASDPPPPAPGESAGAVRTSGLRSTAASPAGANMRNSASLRSP